MDVLGPFNSGIAAGGAGLATSNGLSAVMVHGKLYGVYLGYIDAPPGTTDVTISTGGVAPLPPTQSLLVVSNAAADGWFYPRSAVHDAVGAVIASEWDHFALADFVDVLIAQADNGDNVDAWLLVDALGY